jgi:hypothetical protein
MQCTCTARVVHSNVGLMGGRSGCDKLLVDWGMLILSALVKSTRPAMHVNPTALCSSQPWLPSEPMKCPC